MADLQHCDTFDGGQHCWVVIQWSKDIAHRIYCPTCKLVQSWNAEKNTYEVEK